MLNVILCLVAWIVIFALMTGFLCLIGKAIDSTTDRGSIPFNVCWKASALLSIFTALNVWAIILK